MQKPRSNFNYAFDKVEGVPVLYIVDEDRGGMSVTNDIENVVASIIEGEKELPDKCLIIYRDSEGVWDGWDNDRERFVALQCRSRKEAALLYIKLNQQI